MTTLLSFRIKQALFGATGTISWTCPAVPLPGRPTEDVFGYARPYPFSSSLTQEWYSPPLFRPTYSSEGHHCPPPYGHSPLLNVFWQTQLAVFADARALLVFVLVLLFRAESADVSCKSLFYIVVCCSDTFFKSRRAFSFPDFCFLGDYRIPDTCLSV